MSLKVRSLVAALVLLLVPFSAEAREAVDRHMHLLSPMAAHRLRRLVGPELYGWTIGTSSGATLVSLLDEAGFDGAFALSDAYLVTMAEMGSSDPRFDTRRSNAYAALQVLLHPRLVGFASVNPRIEGAPEAVDEAVDRFGLRGLKLHLANSDVDLRRDGDRKALDAVLERAEARGIPVLLHFRNRNPRFGARDGELLVDLLAEHGELRVQLAHLGGWGGWDEATEALLETILSRFEADPSLGRHRLWLDLSGVACERAIPGLSVADGAGLARIVEMARRWGLDRVVFGSDWWVETTREALDEARRRLPFTEEEWRALLRRDVGDFLEGPRGEAPGLCASSSYPTGY